MSHDNSASARERLQSKPGSHFVNGIHFDPRFPAVRVSRATSSARRLWPSLVPLFFVPAVARGQAVFAPLAPPPTTEHAATSFFSTNGVTAESILTAAAPDPESRNPLRWGPVAAHPRLDYQFIYATGIRQATASNPSNTVTTLQHLIGPGVGLQLGKHWHVDAGVGLNEYSDAALDDSFSYHVGINGAIPADDWTFGVSADFGASDTTQTETAQQTKVESYNAGLTAVYGARKRTNYEFTMGQSISLSENFNNTYSWNLMSWINRVLTTKTSAGLGVGGGYTIVEAGNNSVSQFGTDSANEQVQARVVWMPRSKLSLSVSGGAYIQQFLLESSGTNTARVESSMTPVFSARAGYSPFQSTSFSLSASRTVGSAIASDQFTESTSVAFGIRQRLLGRLTLSVTPTYNLIQYHSSTDPRSSANREDEILGINVALSTVVFKKVNLMTFFNYSDNRSDDQFFAYETRQFGFQLGYRF